MCPLCIDLQKERGTLLRNLDIVINIAQVSLAMKYEDGDKSFGQVRLTASSGSLKDGQFF
jgi:hypothetical protein